MPLGLNPLCPTFIMVTNTPTLSSLASSITEENALEETVLTKTSESTVEDIPVQPDLPANPGLPPCPKRAILSAIACIDHDNFWLTTNGGYHGPTTVCRAILNIKPSCAMTIPGMEPVTSDFGVIIQNLHEINQKCVMPGYSAGRTASPIVQIFSFTQPLGGDENTDDVPHPDSPSNDPYSFKQWPLTRERHDAQLLSLKSTHWLLPTPAYNVEGNLLKPSTYRHYLQSALVEIHFTLSHWGIAEVKQDVYGSEIELIHLLESPQPSSSPVLKKKLPLHLETDDGPHKKSAIA
ncbi:hypothetical protein BKA83DRAFT_4125412 [Pisolithus microcarpus]|nr:hypothetical protein BKA83DRAFT_4125412 [Pisolithus microcarpus]